jgi:hypothetical protein
MTLPQKKNQWCQVSIKELPVKRIKHRFWAVAQGGRQILNGEQPDQPMGFCLFFLMNR